MIYPKPLKKGDKVVVICLSSGILGEPMNEKYFEEYKSVWRDIVNNSKLPILYNVNFGHSAPRAVLPYGAAARVDADRQEITLL